MSNISITPKSFSFILSTAILFSAVFPNASFAGEHTLISWACGKPAVPVVKKENLKYAPSLAYIPSYTGKGSLSTESIHYTGLVTGECYNLKYLMREDADIVHNWYQEALKQCGWTIDEKNSNKCSVSAMHSGNMSCFIYFRQSHKPGFATEVVLRLSVRSGK